MSNNKSIYRLLEMNKKASLSAYKKLLAVKGLDCRISEPTVEKGSIFGLEDLTEYDDSNYYPKRLLLFNIFQESSSGMMEYDTFIEAYALTTFHERLPLQTLIEVEFFGRTMTFKVDDHRNVTPSIGEQLFIKNMLVPAT